MYQLAIISDPIFVSAYMGFSERCQIYHRLWSKFDLPENGQPIFLAEINVRSGNKFK